MDTQVTDVIFRKWKNGQGVIALFPAVPHDAAGRFCMSYEHVGQHGGASYALVVAYTLPAEERDYRELKKELEGIGYKLRVVSRQTKAHKRELDLTRREWLTRHQDSAETVIS